MVEIERQLILKKSKKESDLKDINKEKFILKNKNLELNSLNEEIYILKAREKKKVER